VVDFKLVLPFHFPTFITRHFSLPTASYTCYPTIYASPTQTDSIFTLLIAPSYSSSLSNFPFISSPILPPILFSVILLPLHYFPINYLPISYPSSITCSSLPLHSSTHFSPDPAVLALSSHFQYISNQPLPKPSSPNHTPFKTLPFSIFLPSSLPPHVL